MKKIKKRFYSFIDRNAYKYDLRRRTEKSNGHCARFNQVSLSGEEKKAIKEIWGEYGGDYQFFGFYKQFCGHFDSYFVPNYYDFAEHVLNLRWSAYFLQHKCNLKYIHPPQYRTKVILQKIDGHIVYEDNTEISKQEAISCRKKNPILWQRLQEGKAGEKVYKELF